MLLNLRGEMIELLPEKAIFWQKHLMLILADLHLGKADSLQSLGIPIPSISHQEDFSRLRKLIGDHRPKTVVFLGDLIHDRNSWSAALNFELLQFFKDFSRVNFKLVLGNHEKDSGEALKNWPIELVVGEWRLNPFILSHGHQASAIDSDDFEISGHVHPVIKISQGPVSLRLPCFVESAQGLLMPSFGVLTGGFEIERKKDEKIYAVGDRKIFLAW